MKFFTILLIALVCAISQAKVYSKCELVRALSKAGFPRNDLANWACLVQSESNYNSAAVGPVNTDGSYDFGIFQINSRYWCQINGVGHGCNINCKSLTNDDLSDDIRCAKLIFNGSGFNAWFGWQRKCKGRPLPSIAECGV